MKILIIDIEVHRLFLQGLYRLLQLEGINDVEIALNKREAMERARSLNPDIVILNTCDNAEESLKTLRLVRREIPAAGIIVFVERRHDLKIAQRSGTTGFLLSTVNCKRLLNALHGMDILNRSAVQDVQEHIV